MLNVWRFVGSLLIGIVLLILATGVAKAEPPRLAVADGVALEPATMAIQVDPA